MSFEIEFAWIDADDIRHFYKPGTDSWGHEPGPSTARKPGIIIWSMVIKKVP